MLEAKRDGHIILGVHITDRITEAVEVQKQLTRFGGYIKTRLGLHEVEEPDAGSAGSKNGLMILELVSNEQKARELSEALSGIEGVEVQSMKFRHTEL